MRVRDPATGRWIRATADIVAPDASSLTAAIAVLPSASIERMPRSAAGWQERAWRLWRILGIMYFPTSFKAKQVGRLKWNVKLDGRDLDEEQSEAAVAAVTSPIGTREAARRLALNLEVAGQVFYARSSDEWNVYARTTPKLKELLQAADIRIESWIADPEKPDQATSAMQAALDTAEAIRLASALSRAQDRNRLSQRGILLIPKEGQFPADDPFIPKLERSITAPLSNEYAGEAVVPLVVEYPSELIEKWKHLILDSPYDDKLMARIDAMVTQFAREIDMPPEMLLGNFDSNHWNAWLSSEENYAAHVEPAGEQVGRIFAEAMMQALDGSVAIEVTPDPTDLLAKRSSVADAFEALKLGVVGFDYVRGVIGATEEDAPDDEEFQRILLVTGNAPAPELGAGQADQAAPPPPGRPEPAPSNGVAASVDGADDALDELAARLVDIDIRLLSTLDGMAQMAVARVREDVTPDTVGVQHAVASEMQRLGRAWNREVSAARKSLRSLGIDSTGQQWLEAQQASVDLLMAEMTAFTNETLERADSDMLAIPALVLRRVLATAGGSSNATVAAIVKNPAPTFADPQGFAIGVLPLKALKGQDVEIVQWRFRYGTALRTDPFEEHVAVNGQYMTSDGHTSEGWYPGDHRGCLCWPDPVFRKTKSPRVVSEEVA